MMNGKWTQIVFKAQVCTRIWTIVLGLVLAIVLIEVGVRVTHKHLPWSIQVRTSGTRLYALAGPPLGLLLNDFYRYCVGDDRLFARLSPGLNQVPVQLGPRMYHITSSNLGFEDIGFRVSEPTEAWDGVVVGDSFAFCSGIEIEDCWVQLLAKETNLRLANLGMIGTGSVSHLRYLRDYGWALNPKIVIWQYWTNDPLDDYLHIVEGAVSCPRQNNDTIKTSEPQEAKGVSNVPLAGLRGWLNRTFVVYNVAIVPAARAVFPQLASRQGSRLYEQTRATNGKLLGAYTGGLPPDDPKIVEGMRLTKDAILSGAQEASARDSQFLLVLAPSNLQAYIDFLPSKRLTLQAQAEDMMMDELVAFAVENNIDFVDLRPIFREAAVRGDDLFFSYDLHWNTGGNRLAAATLADWYQDNMR